MLPGGCEVEALGDSECFQVVRWKLLLGNGGELVCGFPGCVLAPEPKEVIEAFAVGAEVGLGLCEFEFGLLKHGTLVGKLQVGDVPSLTLPCGEVSAGFIDFGNRLKPRD